MNRFWAKVSKGDGCWIWTGAGGRYGSFRLGPHEARPAHRVSWMLENGPIPTGMNVLHHCDNPMCVRPSHLFLGTQADNVSDMYRKGRHGSPDNNYNLPAGKDHHFYHRGHKITREDACAIRHATGLQKDIAAKYGISRSLVCRIKRGIHWKE